MSDENLSDELIAGSPVVIRPGARFLFESTDGDDLDVWVVESEDGLPYLVNLRFMDANNGAVTDVPLASIHSAGFIGY